MLLHVGQTGGVRKVSVGRTRCGVKEERKEGRKRRTE